MADRTETRQGTRIDSANPFGVTPLAKPPAAPTNRKADKWATIVVGTILALASGGYLANLLQRHAVETNRTQTVVATSDAGAAEIARSPEPEISPALPPASPTAVAPPPSVPTLPLVAVAPVPPPETTIAEATPEAETAQPEPASVTATAVEPPPAVALQPQPEATPIAPSVTLTATEPKPAAVPAQPDPALAPLLRRAEALLSSGDVAAARMLVERAASGGDARALFALAETYDPVRLSDWHVRGVRADVAKARALYQQALDHGDERAGDRLGRLR